MPPLNDESTRRRDALSKHTPGPAKQPPVRRPVVVHELGPDDVLLGRGTGPNEYEGNVRFRALIRDIINDSDVQDSEDSKAKTKLAVKIVQAVKDRNGRFLQRAAGSRSRSTRGSTFIVAQDKVALDKTKQSLRHQLRMMDPNYKQNKENKLQLKKLREKMIQSSSAPVASHFGLAERNKKDTSSGFTVNLSTSHNTAQDNPPINLLGSQPQGGRSNQDAISQLLSSIAGGVPEQPRADVAVTANALAAALSQVLALSTSQASNPPRANAANPNHGGCVPSTQLQNILAQISPSLAQAVQPVAPASAPTDQTALLLQLLGGAQARPQPAEDATVTMLLRLLGVNDQSQLVSQLIRQLLNQCQPSASSLDSTALLNMLFRQQNRATGL